MSWWQLVSWQREVVDAKSAADQAGPLSCPHDGQPLTAGPGGVWFCVFDGWRPSGDPRRDLPHL